jgi:hypothetical protein
VDGSLARFIILPTEEDYPDENRTGGPRQTPPALIDGLQRLAGGGGGASGDIADQTTGATLAKVHRVAVGRTPDLKSN